MFFSFSVSSQQRIMEFKNIGELTESLQEIFKPRLQCSVCSKFTAEPLHGLCSDHIFCSLKCSGKKSCPKCQKPLKMENSKIRFTVLRDLLPKLDKSTESSKTVESRGTSLDSEISKSKSTNVNKQKRSSIVGASDVNKRNKKGETLLHVACIKGDIHEVQRLLEQKANIYTKDNAGWTPLHEVVQQVQGSKLAELLLKHGAGPNVPGFALNSPLHEAAQAGAVDTVKLLLRYGADREQRNHEVVQQVQGSKLAELLLKHGAGPNVPGFALNSPLHEAAQAGAVDTVKLLLRYDISSLDRPLLVMDAKLSPQELALLTSLTKSLPITHAKTPSGDVRVVVTKANLNICERSLPVLLGMTVGAWIVSPDSCENSNNISDPEVFEIYGVRGYQKGGVPQIARNNFRDLMPGLFAGCHIYLGGRLELGDGLNRTSLTLLIKLAGAVVLSRSPDPENIPDAEHTVPWHATADSPLAACSHYIIYEAGHREPQIKYNMRHIKSLPHTWLIACMENFTLLDPPKNL
ncbi:hypothetical protein B566_EDAN003954 [Ephemera danica]|nr:hypothetical protein B566_EDAN003954 [Ephemera danica]